MSTDAATLPDALSDTARSFATGPHLCMGARLARYETRVAWRLLLERLPRLRLEPDTRVEISGWEFRSPHELKVRWN